MGQAINSCVEKVKVRKNKPFLNWFCTAVLLMALWFIMSGMTEPKFLILGTASSIIIASVCLRTMTMRGTKTDRDYYLLAVSIPRFIVYFFWLLWQIAKSAFYVSGLSVSAKRKADPSNVWFRADYDNPAARAMLANSITLTPGSITMDIAEVKGQTYYYIHWINVTTQDHKAAGDAIKSKLEKGVGRIWK